MATRGTFTRRRTFVTVGIALIVVGATWLGVQLGVGSSSGGFYLVIGASAAKGFEPIGTMGPRGPNEAATNNGYANDVDEMLAGRGSPLTLVNIACPGETIQTLVNGGDACSPTTSMLSRAESFLRERYDDTGVVTIDVGFNNIRPCLQFTTVDASCIESSVALIKSDLPRVLSGLEKAAGPGVTFVGIPYGDPYLGHYVNSSQGPANATSTLRAMKEMDAALDNAFEASKIAVAPVATALKMNDTELTGHYDGRVVPEDVAMACDTTWMCRAAPWGPNDHPNNEGYAIIAKSIVEELPASF
jgi:lysophospholipase L1-like esterase